LNKASGIVNCRPDQCLHRTVLDCSGGPTNIPQVAAGTNLFVPSSCDARLGNGLTFVSAGGILEIQKGTTIRAAESVPLTALIVKPGGRIDASGDAAGPIVSTSTAATPYAGAWAGISILGKAPVNQPGITLDGLPPDPSLVYGGTDANDFSGCLQYVR